MSALQEPLERYRMLLDAAAPNLPGREIAWLATQRAAATQQLLQSGFPTRKTEAWRYTSLDRVLEPAWEVPRQYGAALDIGEYTLSDDAAARLVFVNGHWVAELSSTHALPEGVYMGSLRTALEVMPDTVATWLENSAAMRLSAFTALNTALLDDGVWLHISAGTKLTTPIELLHVCIAQDATPTAQLRNVIVLDDGAEAMLLEQYTGIGEAPSFTNSLTEIRLGRHARLEHARLQDEGPSARHLSYVCLHQQAHSRYRGLSMSLGGLWSRSEYHNRMCEQHTQFELDGLYIAGGHQLSDVHLAITHAVPHCTSRERFKGIVLGQGRAVFDGRIRVEQDAQKSAAELHNANLLLSRTAEIDTKPQLEIYADDVKCSHGTSIGQLEPAQLFYLRSRGIGLDAARRLLCQGFVMEILEGWHIPALHTRVAQRLDRLLAETPQADSDPH
ncbi:MAG: Fe-S cluster assembly protein SufD [Gammaproteobacteria bacterium]|nr:Fe-S cluster assembly protein SufD [Gammaproteobacteria bacterium]